MSLRDFDLTGRVAMLTGAGGHLGQAMAEALAAAGALVYLNGRRPAVLEELRDRLRNSGHMAEIAAFDVTDAAAVDKCLDQIAKSHGRLDVLINNAYAGINGGFD